MATWIRQRPTGWFTLIAVLLVAWGLLGCLSLYLHIAYGPDIDPAATDWDRAFYAALPAWLNAVYAVAVGTGLLGSIALLMRSRLARPLYLVSLIAVIVQFGTLFLTTDLIAHKGVVVATGFPIFIALMAVFQIWFAGYAQRRGWLG
ncbi:hypothetical protein FHS95_001122 [Sphingomonas naasensis]|uniref:hypothetical protein n=1 Tax=Sphingomonas naasensis TaxID=1344951 RepID=UPI001F0D5354|nr:hypothetical protein [Sphingomonas naasensis]NIJ19453.1 hypothetical protein [Sphingomonas naasensis]